MTLLPRWSNRKLRSGQRKRDNYTVVAPRPPFLHPNLLHELSNTVRVCGGGGQRRISRWLLIENQMQAGAEWLPTPPSRLSVARRSPPFQPSARVGQRRHQMELPAPVLCRGPGQAPGDACSLCKVSWVGAAGRGPHTKLGQPPCQAASLARGHGRDRIIARRPAPK